MSRISNIESFVGKNLSDSYDELMTIGALRNWSPFYYINKNNSQIELRFNNHWGTIVQDNEINYSILITNALGQIIDVKLKQIKSLESDHFLFKNEYGDLGAVYFGCISENIVNHVKDSQSIADYFYLAYEIESNYSIVHSQPFNPLTNNTGAMKELNRASWTNCVEIIKDENPMILLGNPSKNYSKGYVTISQKINIINKVEISLKPFEVKKIELNKYENGWYLINSFAGGSNAQIFKINKEKIYITHM